MLEQCLRQIIGQRDLLQTDEVPLSDASRRVVVAVVGIAQIGILLILSAAEDAWYVCLLLLAGLYPAVVERLGSWRTYRCTWL